MDWSSSLSDRLCRNLRAAGIEPTEADLERVMADGYLQRAATHVETLGAVDGDVEPDWLTDWTPPEGAPEAAARTTAAAEPGTIAELAPRIEAGGVSPVELTEEALARVEVRDGELNAFQLVLPERSLRAARRAEAEIGRGDYRGPLHGVPLAVKDLLAMRGTVTSAGSRALRDNVTDFDAAAVERLEEAGAVLIGKTRLPEFAFWPGSTNPHYGPTANPHDATRDAGGSSSGSGAAVAAGIVPAALGSDTGGSIRIPSALCGVVGLKPTFGRVSLFGCTPLAWSLDHLGPLTRSAHDAAFLLAVLAGHDPRDPRSRAGSAFSVPDDLHAGVAGLRVGVPGSWGSAASLAGEPAAGAWERSSRALEAAGATLVEVDVPEVTALRAASFLILSVEAAAYHAHGLRTRYGEYGSPCRDRLLGGFAYSAHDYVQAQRFLAKARCKWDEIFDRIDVLSTPAQPGVAPALGVMASVKFTNVFNALGWPAVTVPYGSGEGGLPLATQLAGRPWDEATILRAAQALEDAR